MPRTRDEGMEARILLSAMKVFGDRGFQETTLKDIAAGAGISAASIYTYFPDKQQLFGAAAAFGWDRFNADLESLAAEALSIEERRAALVDTGFEALTGALPLLRGMLFDASRQDLVRPGLGRVIDSIDRLFVGPVGDSPASAALAAARRPLVEIFVTGILFSAGLGDPRSADAEIAGLKAAMMAFFDLIDRSAP